jgi:RsmE family RNA methyltransferase
VNLLLFDAAEREGDDRVRIRGRRALHLREVFEAAAGHVLPVGEIDGRLGTGTVLHLDGDEALLAVTLERDPPPRLPLVLVLALPRPKMLRRLLRAVAEFGVSDLVLINSERVEKSFWQSELLADSALRDYCLAGAAQARDTRLPAVTLRRRFRPFAEDELPALCAGRQALVAHPGATLPCPASPAGPLLLAIGPEAGFNSFEVGLLQAAGCTPVSLGLRTLRVETALVAALGRLGAPAHRA